MASSRWPSSALHTRRRDTAPDASATATTGPARILGIDPGSRKTGVGVIDVDAGGQLAYVSHDTLEVGKEASFPLRLKRIHEQLCAIITSRQPVECGIERVFVARNADSALKLGQARGAAIAAVVCQGVTVHEYAPTEVKQSVVGGGRASKQQIQHMVAMLLGLTASVQEDAADALAIAVTHAHMRAGMQRLGVSGHTRRSR